MASLRLHVLLIASLVVVTLAPSPSAANAQPAIDIDGDADLAAQAAANGWPGSGTAADPYVIADLTISATAPQGIRVANVVLYNLDAHLVLDNVHLLGGVDRYDQGIFARNVDNLTIRDSVFEGEGTGLVVESFPTGDNIRLERNTFATLGNSMTFINTNGLVIQDNVIHGWGWVRADNVDIRGNTYYASANYEGAAWTVEHNDFLPVAGAPISYLSARNLEEWDWNNNHATHLRVHRSITNAAFTNSTFTQMWLHELDAPASGLAIAGNAIGALRVHAAGATIEGNHLGEITLERTSGTALRGNDIVGDGQTVGIFLSGSAANVVSSNVVSGHATGLQLQNADDNSIFDNLFDNSRNANVNTASTGNLWSTVPGVGPNVVGGLLLGGNYWSDYEGEDRTGDGFGDTPYVAGNPVGMAPDVCFQVCVTSGLQSVMQPRWGPGPVDPLPLVR